MLWGSGRSKRGKKIEGSRQTRRSLSGCLARRRTHGTFEGRAAEGELPVARGDVKDDAVAGGETRREGCGEGCRGCGVRRVGCFEGGGSQGRRACCAVVEEEGEGREDRHEVRAEVRRCGGAGEVAGEEVGVGGRFPGLLREMARIIKDGSEAERRERRAAPMPRLA